MDGREGFRLRTVKLRGEISQGLLLNPAILERPVEIGEDVTDELGIVKCEPPMPACLGGDVIGGFPAFIAKTYEERIQKLADEFGSHRLKSPTVSVFNVFDIAASTDVQKTQMVAICEALDVLIVPPLGEMVVPEDIDAILGFAEGKSALNPTAEREGLVWVRGSGDDRISFKTISNRFLAKDGD